MATKPTSLPAAELKRIRTEILDVTQKEMAAALRLDLRTYQRYETGLVVKVPASVLDEARMLAVQEGI